MSAHQYRILYADDTHYHHSLVKMNMETKYNKIAFQSKADCRKMCTFSYAWLLTDRDKDSGHTIQSAIAKNPKIHANFMALYLAELELLPIVVLHCGNRVCK